MARDKRSHQFNYNELTLRPKLQKCDINTDTPFIFLHITYYSMEKV